MAANKDSVEVVRFRTLFSQLKDWSDNEPSELFELAARDGSIKQLCLQLSSAARPLESSQRRSRELFAVPVDPAFIVDWRDYESRFAPILAQIWLADLLPSLTFEQSKSTERSDRDWESADESAQETSAAIEAAINFAIEQVAEEWRDFAEDFRESIEEGAASWGRLKDSTAFEPRGIFRRRELVPFVLIPRQVAARISDEHPLSLYKSLQQAHDAFIFGAPFAALALMRSILEAVLRDHYGAQGDNLRERIMSARGRLPTGVEVGPLDYLRRLANSVLHLDVEDDLPQGGQEEMEKNIVALLFVLRTLIEKAPRRR